MHFKSIFIGLLIATAIFMGLRYLNQKYDVEDLRPKLSPDLKRLYTY